MLDKALNPNSDNTVPFPIPAKLAVGQIPTIKEPIILGDWIIWLEQRPNERGRTTALIRPWMGNQLEAQELTPKPINLKTRIHTYGGGVFTAFIDQDQLFLIWIDDSEGCLCKQSFFILPKKKNQNKNWLEPSSKLICLSKQNLYALGGGLIDIKKNRWIGFLEKDEKDFLVSFELNKENQNPKFLHQSIDFAGYATLNFECNQLAWVEWQQPNMPWDNSQLWWGFINEEGDIISKKCIAGSSFNNKKDISVFQPIWLKTGELLVTEDSSGWWNLMISNISYTDKDFPKWQRIFTLDTESAMPQWIFGMSTTSFSNEKIVSANCKHGLWQIDLIDSDGARSIINQPFDDLSYLQADNEKILAVASSPVKGSGLLEIDLKTGNWNHSNNFPFQLNNNSISKAELFVFDGFEGKKTYAWYYPPSNSFECKVPLLVKSHSGPTAMAGRGLDWSIQFWTSRGWGVVDVNYGGSTGFGRSYRERLKGNWGLVDVYDCELAAKTLISSGKADPRWIAIEGGSAGGFTTLSCLCSSDIFKVGACRYGVTDLIALTKETHRFERGYLEYLLGSIQKKYQIYKSRSPINNLHNINCPVIFFQGLKDKVVPPDQTNLIVQSLIKKNIPVELHTYKNEAHGFKDADVRIDVLEKTENFFNKHLDIKCNF